MTQRNQRKKASRYKSNFFVCGILEKVQKCSKSSIGNGIHFNALIFNFSATATACRIENPQQKCQNHENADGQKCPCDYSTCFPRIFILIVIHL